MKLSKKCKECGMPLVTLFKFKGGGLVRGCAYVGDVISSHTVEVMDSVQEDESGLNNADLDYIESWITDLVTGDAEVMNDNGLISEEALVVLSKLKALRGEEDEYIN